MTSQAGEAGSAAAAVSRSGVIGMSRSMPAARPPRRPTGKRRGAGRGKEARPRKRGTARGGAWGGVRLLEWSAMRVRVGAALVAATVGIGIAVGTPGVAVAAAGQRVCRVADRRMTELSGMVATKSGYIVVNDGSDDPAARQIFYLDQSCAVTRTVKYPSRPRDTEDMGLAGDGTLWVADIGDNDSNRDSIGLWRLPAGARKPQLFRLKYPDGPHDAEAL